MSPLKYQIAQINTHDNIGGAAQIAWNLFHAYQQKEYPSSLLVGFKHSSDPNVMSLFQDQKTNVNKKYSPSFPGEILKLNSILLNSLNNKIRNLKHRGNRFCGIEDFNFPDSWNLFNKLPWKPDLIHAHNLHGDYFDLRVLSYYSKIVPIIITLHDAWLLSGHCAHSFSCDRWKTGCGKCPDLTINPPVQRDATAYNWHRKQTIYNQSRMYLVSPCQWLMSKVSQSILTPSIALSRVIPNGVNLDIFRPQDKKIAKSQLNISSDKRVLLFAANGIRNNIFKDFQTLESAIGMIANRLGCQSILLLALGEDAPQEEINGATIEFIPPQTDPNLVSQYYNAADVYIHATKIDTFPNTILEALACGTPVVATNTGGISEQIIEGDTGFLTALSDSTMLAERVITLLEDVELCTKMGFQASEYAKNFFGLDQMVNNYLKFYEECIADWERHNNFKNE